MVISFRENVGALEHFFKGLHRVVFQVPVTKEFDLLCKKTDRVRLLVDDKKRPIACKGCGYAIVRLVYPDGWEVESCSAITAPQLVNNKKFDDWVASIPGAQITTKSDEASLAI